MVLVDLSKIPYNVLRQFQWPWNTLMRKIYISSWCPRPNLNFCIRMMPFYCCCKSADSKVIHALALFTLGGAFTSLHDHYDKTSWIWTFQKVEVKYQKDFSRTKLLQSCLEIFVFTICSYTSTVIIRMLIILQ